MRHHTTPDDYGPIFGSGFAKQLEAPILLIGSAAYNRLDLAALGITQLRACRTISRLSADLKASSVRDLYRRLDSATLSRTEGFGLHCLFVLWRVFEASGLDSSRWYWAGREGAIRTFSTLKHRQAREAAQAKRALPRRARAHLREVGARAS